MALFGSSAGTGATPPQKRVYPPIVQQAFRKRRFAYLLLVLLIAFGIYFAVFFQQRGYTSASILFILLTVFSAFTVLIINEFQHFAYNRVGETHTVQQQWFRATAAFGLFLLGVAALATMFYFATQYSMQSNSFQWFSNTLQWALLLALTGVLFKIFNFGGIVSNHPLSRLVGHTILYLPCLLMMPISFLGRATGLLGSSGTSSLTSVRAMLNEPSTPEDRKFLLGVLALIGGTFFANRYLRPRVMRHLTSQGGNQLVSSPTTLKTETLLATYSALSDLGVQTRTEKPIYDYQYAISFWIYIDAFGPAASTQNVQVMGYGNTIFLHYNSFKNTLSFLTRKNSADATPRILYRAEGFPLQKWNHIVLQNHGGTLDIFYNSELVKSSARVVSQIGADALSIGDPKGAGVSGDITNLVYFNRPIDVTTVRRLYMMGTETRE